MVGENLRGVSFRCLFSTHSLSWDTSVRDVMGEDFYLSGGHRSNITSLRDLVAHRTGVPRHDMVSLLDQWSREELIELS